MVVEIDVDSVRFWVFMGFNLVRIRVLDLRAFCWADLRFWIVS